MLKIGIFNRMFNQNDTHADRFPVHWLHGLRTGERPCVSDTKLSRRIVTEHDQVARFGEQNRMFRAHRNINHTTADATQSCWNAFFLNFRLHRNYRNHVITDGIYISNDADLMAGIKLNTYGINPM